MSGLTIPADQLVNIIPGVLAAGGNGLQLLGVCLTTSTRVPIAPLGFTLSFPNAAAVGAFFGLNSNEFTEAQVYFQGYTGRTAIPPAMLFTQYPLNAVGAYLRGGNISGLTLAQLQAITGTLSVVMDGLTYAAGSISLTGAASFSAAASTIQTDLNASLPTAATVTGTIGSSFTGTGTGTSLAVTAVTGFISPGDKISGTGVPANTTIVSGPAGGGAGTYITSAVTTANSAAITATSTVLNVTAVASGTLAPGLVLSGGTIAANTTVTSLGTGTGATGTYNLSGAAQGQTSTSITASGPALSVAFDSTSGAFTVASGSTGAGSSAAFATGGASAALLLTSATGATLSQGAAATNPAAFMTAVTNYTQNWASFFTAFDPDGGSGNTQKKAFAAWNGTQNNRWVYAAWDTDITPTESTNAASSLGQTLKTNKTSGTIVIYEPTNLHLAAFVCGMIASINFNQKQGRITLAGKTQSGLVPSVTDGTKAQNLIANGYNFLGIYSTANQTFNYFQPGSISGEDDWADTYVDAIYLNNQLQVAIMLGLGQVNSMPYNAPGYAILKAFCLDPIGQFVNFGGAQPGVTLSDAQIEEINNVAGNQQAAATVQTQGYYLQVVPASPQVRQARTSPPVNLWYEDGGSIQQVSVSSIAVQ